MFEKADVEAYKNIKAPYELKEKVMMANNKRSFSYYKMQAVPACVAAMMAFAMIGNWNHSYARIPGAVTSAETGVQTATFASLDSRIRMISQNSISVKLDSNHKRKVAVSEGSLQYVDSQSGETVMGDSKLWVEANAEILWTLDLQVDKSYELSVSGWGKDERFLLIFDQENEHWQLKQQ